ncbi:hypothetical protein PILCRDRAFT_4246 [Piloderma croceum F 1598]|uniref:Uncharacterized protein n=1 Tax=Piloderma croceum (strain F 1598) TaxID=765440 RepID=A0A0C3BKP5_PILCF|nr:hypothetical protein PILCRDRAFT_4246 [Piloderma croceum F 1598]
MNRPHIESNQSRNSRKATPMTASLGPDRYLVIPNASHALRRVPDNHPANEVVDSGRAFFNYSDMAELSIFASFSSSVESSWANCDSAGLPAR